MKKSVFTHFPRVNAWLKAGAGFAVSAAALILAAACVPPIDVLDKKTGGTEDIPYDCYVKIEVPGAGRGSRSMRTETQVSSAINYHELIVFKLKGDPGSPAGYTSGTPVDYPAGSGKWVGEVDTTWVGSDRKRSGQGSLIVPLETGNYYGILYLRGYRSPDNTNTVLLNSDYWTAGPTGTGPVLVQVASPPNLIRLEDYYDDGVAINDSYLFDVAPVMPEIRQDSTNFNLAYAHFPLASGAKPLNTIDVTVGNVLPLIQAAAAFKGAAVTLGTDSIFKNPPRLTVKPYIDTSNPSGSHPGGQGVIDKVLGAQAGLPGSEAASTLEFEIKLRFANIPDSEFPTIPGDALMNFSAAYTGFSPDLSGSPAWWQNLPADKQFTEWTVRRGLDNDVDIDNRSGGSIFILFGGGSNGGTGGGNTAGPSIIIQNP